MHVRPPCDLGSATCQLKYKRDCSARLLERSMHCVDELDEWPSTNRPTRELQTAERDQ